MLDEHQPIVIEEFNGYWKRGDVDSVPRDHFSEVNNIQYMESGFRTRDGLDTMFGQTNIIRIYSYKTATDDGFLVLDTNGDIYHIEPTGATSILILHVTGMNDFKYALINNRAYISPMQTPPSGPFNEFIYVYKGDASAARRAGGTPPKDADGALAAASSVTAGHVELGYHIFGVVYETDTGYLTQIGPDTLPALNVTTANKKVDLSNIPVSPNSYVTKRHIVATKAIDPTLYTGDTRGYQFFFVPNGTISNNTATTLTVDFFDVELLDDASHLLDLLENIPAALALTVYHGRLITGGEPGNPIVRASYPGEPEAFDAVSGLDLLPIDGLNITNLANFRDILYIYKLNRTYAKPDNGDVFSSWPISEIDSGIGAGLHGVAAINSDEGGIHTEFIANFDLNGIHVFSGQYLDPLLSHKIWKFWTADIDTGDITYNCEFYVDTVHKMLYINIPSAFMILMGDFSNGMDIKSIRWSKWTFEIVPRTITLFNRIPDLIIASDTEITA